MGEQLQPLVVDGPRPVVVWVSTLPAHVNINSIEMMPVSQSLAGLQVHREG